MSVICCLKFYYCMFKQNATPCPILVTRLPLPYVVLKYSDIKVPATLITVMFDSRKDTVSTRTIVFIISKHSC